MTPQPEESALEDAPVSIRRRDYVQVIDTNDEWEDLIGVVESLYDASGDVCRAGPLAVAAEIRFPLGRSSQYAMNLIGVNFFTDYVRTQLRLSDELQVVPVKNLEVVDRDNL